LKEMDEAGIDLQVLSHTMPGLQKLDAETAVPLARRANDRLAEAVRAHPDRFAVFAALPTDDPEAAADELERTVGRFGFKGEMVNGLTDGVFLDDKRFWPIFERAQALDVPLLHASGNPTSCGHRGLPQGLRRETSGNLARRLGIHRRDRDARYSPRAERRIRRLAAP
jgi:predicted TIM-barrel fold metal-dependent hydrolase